MSSPLRARLGAWGELAAAPEEENGVCHCPEGKELLLPPAVFGLCHILMGGIRARAGASEQPQAPQSVKWVLLLEFRSSGN